MNQTMTFCEYMEREVGPKWVIARRTKNNLRRYQGSTFLTQKRYAELKAAYHVENS